MLVAAALLLYCVAAQNDAPVDHDDASLPPPSNDAAIDPAEGPVFDVAKLRALRGKHLEVVRVDGDVVKGGLLEVHDDRIVLVGDAGERIPVHAIVVRSWRVTQPSPQKRRAPDLRPSAMSIAFGAGACTAVGCAVGGAGVGLLALSTGEAVPPIILCPLVVPIVTSGGGAALGFILSDEEELPSPTIAIVMGAAVVGAVGGGILGAIPAFMATVIPFGFYLGVGGAFVGATAGSALSAYVVAQQLAIARE